MWSMPEQEFGYKIPNFARSLYDPFRIFYSPSFIITAKITAACWSLSLGPNVYSLWSTFTESHPSPSVAISCFHCFRILRGFLTHILHLCPACGRPARRCWHPSRGSGRWRRLDCGWRKDYAWQPRWNRNNITFCVIRIMGYNNEDGEDNWALNMLQLILRGNSTWFILICSAIEFHKSYWDFNNLSYS